MAIVANYPNNSKHEWNW